MTDSQSTITIRQLNDEFRQSLLSGTIMLTHGVSQLPSLQLAQLLDLVQRYDTFSTDNDPYGEHDFGSIDMDGARYFWKIDYYDRSLENGSENPADPSMTTRVLTVMKAEEY